MKTETITIEDINLMLRFDFGISKSIDYNVCIMPLKLYN